MKKELKEFTVNGAKYTFLTCTFIDVDHGGMPAKELTIIDPYGDECTLRTCTAIATDSGYTERQDALLVVSTQNSEKAEFVVFGWEMPETAEDFVAMCEDFSVRDSYQDTLDTVEY